MAGLIITRLHLIKENYNSVGNLSFQSSCNGLQMYLKLLSIENLESIKISIPATNTDVILTSAVEGQGFVSIDGKRTYLNLFDAKTTGNEPTKTQHPAVVGTRYPPSRRPTFHRRPTQPLVRIDTCIVGDSSTCDASQHESCATAQGVSACHCKPGYARLQHSLPCKSTHSQIQLNFTCNI